MCHDSGRCCGVRASETSNESTVMHHANMNAMREEKALHRELHSTRLTTVAEASDVIVFLASVDVALTGLCFKLKCYVRTIFVQLKHSL